MTEKRHPGRPVGTKKQAYLGMTERELNALFKTVKAAKDTESELAFKLAFHFALRISEVTRLQLNDIFIGRSPAELTITIQGLKHGMRRVYQGTEIEGHLSALLLRWIRKERRPLAAENPYLFPSHRYWDRPIDTGTLWGSFKRYAQQAKLPSYYTFHSLRHSCAYYLLSKNWSLVQVRNWMRLRSVQNVQVYVDQTETNMSGKVGGEYGAFSELM